MLPSYDSGAALREAVVRAVGYELSNEDWNRIDDDGSYGLDASYDHDDYLDLRRRAEKYLSNQGWSLNSYSLRATKVLRSARWRDLVTTARSRLSVPVRGLQLAQVRMMHDALLATIVGRIPTVSAGTKQLVPNPFWLGAITESIPLALALRVDPHLLIKLRDQFMRGSADVLPGVSKLMNPDSVFRIGGRTVPFHPSPTDRVMMHLLCRLELDASDLSPGPAVYFGWTRAPDGSGNWSERTYDLASTRPIESKKLVQRLRAIKRSTKLQALHFLPDIPWAERYQQWNRINPELAFPSLDAMKHFVYYHKEKNG